MKLNANVPYIFSEKLTPNIFVWLPGFGGSKSSFKEEKARIEELGYSWLAWDYPGHGDNTEAFDFVKTCQLLFEIVDQLVMENFSVHLFGHSLGASIALMLGATLEDKKCQYKDSVKLVVSISSPEKVGDVFNMNPILSGLRSLDNMLQTKWLGKAIDWFYATPKKMGNILFDAASISKFLEDSEKYQMIDYVDKISPVPLLIAHGQKDYIVNVSHAYDLYAKAKEPKDLVILRKSEHDIHPEDVPILFNAVKKHLHVPGTM
jgi:pimeloyl-ACP methyl ester carboxylesterase